MQQLTGLDNAFLRMESKRVPTHVSGLVFLDPTSSGKDWGIADIRKLIETRIHLVPPMRRRLAYVPGNLDHPYWIEDPDFDLDYHLRHRALPKPGNAKQLEELICQIFMRTLDRTRPLWELYYIEGLENGQVCIFSKMHHACIDGMSGQEIMANLMDLSPKLREVPPPATPWKPEEVPSDRDLLDRAWKNYATMPRRFIEMLPSLVQPVVNISKVALFTDMKMPKAPYQAPRSVFNQMATTQRRFAYGSISLQSVKSLKDAYGCSLNDFVMALVGTALRDYCLDIGMLPKEPLLAMIPISVRDEKTKNQMGNFVSSMYCSLATDIADPKLRLQAVAESGNSGKAGQKMVGANSLMDWTQFAAPAVLGLAARTMSSVSVNNRIRPPFNVVISNVPGPRVPLYWAGARILANFPMSVTMENVGINITLMSYQDNIDFGITTDKGVVPDPWVILEGMGKALNTYAELAKIKVDTTVTKGLPPVQITQNTVASAELPKPKAATKEEAVPAETKAAAKPKAPAKPKTPPQAKTPAAAKPAKPAAAKTKAADAAA